MAFVPTPVLRERLQSMRLRCAAAPLLAAVIVASGCSDDQKNGRGEGPDGSKVSGDSGTGGSGGAKAGGTGGVSGESNDSGAGGTAIATGGKGGDAGRKPDSGGTGGARVPDGGEPDSANDAGTVSLDAATSGDGAQVLPHLKTIQVTPSGAVLAAPASMQFTATGVYSDGSSQDLTNVVVWSATGAGSISSAGNLTTPLNPSQSDGLVSATLDGVGKSVPYSVDTTLINDLYVQLYRTKLGVGQNCFTYDRSLPPAGSAGDPTEPPATSPSWVMTNEQACTGFHTVVRALGKSPVTGQWTDVTDQVTWGMLDSGTGTQLGSGGLVTTDGPGTVRFVAALPASGVQSNPQAGTARENGTLSVTATSITSIAIDPENVKTLGDPQFGTDPVFLALGRSTALKVTGTFYGVGPYCVTFDAQFSSDKPLLASVDSTGTVTAKGTGTASITASLGGSISDTIPINVGGPELDFVEISPSQSSVSINGTTPVSAIAHLSDGTTVNRSSDPSAVWKSSSTSLSVSASGVVKPTGTASVGDTASIGVCLSSPVVDVGGNSGSAVVCSNESDPSQSPRVALGAPPLTAQDRSAAVTVTQ
jgi:hypothetical protein